jgi:ribosomal protein S8
MYVNKVPMIYKKHPKCLVCNNPNGLKIDKDLMQRVPFQEIAANRAHLFKDASQPLTQHVVYNHWQHMKEAVETLVHLAMDGSNLPATLAPNNAPHDPARQRVFSEMVHRRVDEIQIMEDLLLSGLDDLKGLQPDPNEDVKADNHDTKRLRNQVRKDTALITMESAKIKQMAAQAAKEQEHVERSRLVFRLFEVFRASLEAVPEGVKGDISTRLKTALNQDAEIKELLSLSQRQARESLPEPSAIAANSDE